MDYAKTGTWLLLLGGLVHGIPALYSWLTGLLGYPWVQVVVGWASVLCAVMMLK